MSFFFISSVRLSHVLSIHQTPSFLLLLSSLNLSLRPNKSWVWPHFNDLHSWNLSSMNLVSHYCSLRCAFVAPRSQMFIRSLRRGCTFFLFYCPSFSEFGPSLSCTLNWVPQSQSGYQILVPHASIIEN